MAGRHCVLIVNPTSGSYSPHGIDAVMSALRQRGYSIELLLTGSAADAPLFARRICAEEAEPLIIVGGGDGTINGVLNGLTPGRGTLGILPLGTANVLTWELGIRSLEDSVHRIVRRETRNLAVGLIEAEGKRTYFTLMAGIGFDGAVVEDVRLEEKKRLGKGAYLLAALRRLAAWDRELQQIQVDGREMGCHSAVVCNGARYGGNFVLAPAADILAPGFQVVCIGSDRRRAYAKLAFDLVRGQGPRGGGITTVPARIVEVPGTTAIQVDGDYWGHGPCRITAVENFVKIIV